MNTARLAAAAAALLLPSLPLAAQGAAGTTHFLVADALAPGGSAQAGLYALTTELGPGPATAGAAGGTYALEGGFPASLAVSPTGRPWLTGVVPPRATMRGGAALTLWGTELDLGAGATLTIGGVPAPLLARTRATITTALPVLAAPGPQPVVLSTSFGTSILPRGLGVLPLIETQNPIAVARSGELLFQGRQGDLMIWLFGFGQLPAPLPIAGLGHGLLLDFSLPLLTTSAVGVTDPSGVLRLPVPPLPAAVTFHIQALALSSDPGYAPGSFTNALRVF